MFEAIPINGQTWLICGGRDFMDWAVFDSAMGDLIRIKGMPTRIIQGGAAGADEMARLWAARHAVEVQTEPANWLLHGRAAGPIRNQAMLDRHKPSMVVAFPGGKGTADMVRRSRVAGVEIAEIEVTV